jgi:glycosyltransferase involved in cell wall biosynthesis
VVDTLPLVTVIAVCYNHSRFALESLESIRHQTYQNIQLIIIDDCSTDDSVAVIQNWMAAHQVESTFIAHAENKGVCATLNECLAHARGKYVSLIATDDVWVLDKIENQVRQMEELPEDVAVLYSDAWQMDESGALLPEMFIESHRSFTSAPEGHIFSVLLESNFIPAMTTLIRKSCLDKVGLYDESLCYEDWDMWLRLARHFNFSFSTSVAAKYRIVSSSAVRTMARSRNNELQVSNYLIYAKCLRFCRAQKGPSLSEEIKTIKYKMVAIAESLYHNHYEKRNYYLLSALMRSPELRTLALAAFSLSGIPYPVFYNSYSLFSKYRQRLLGLTT